ncbi:uncharacterized protein LOC126788300 [Argentina anserina]|uniref:uncharacterized protein LOC126788300 n=1 Tax=Argentina anserina TaxID=57926 RepID=UPI0021769155|nr:uncharacterized protein LOC126788300 [Potentilla anserina]
MSGEEAPLVCVSSGVVDPTYEFIDDKAPLWKFVKKIQKQGNGGNCKWQCNFCNLFYNGSYTRVRCHLLKEGTSGVASCTGVTPDVYNEMLELVKECKERLLKGAPRQVLNATPKQVHFPSTKIQRSSTSSSHEVSLPDPADCTQESLKKLTEENEKLIRKNYRYLELWDKACEENHEVLNKNKLLENEKKDLEEVVLQQREMILNLQTEVSKLERQLLEKEMFDSQHDTLIDNIEYNNSDGEEGKEESGGEDGEDAETGKHMAGRKAKQGGASEKENVRKQATRSKRVKSSAVDGDEDLEEQPAKRTRKGKKQSVKS